MRVDFQQGIITYPTSNGQQVFLTKSGSYVNMQTVNGRTDITFAHGLENYLYTESSTVSNAWGPFLPNIDYWLYWDIDMRTAVRTFGVTTVQPTSGVLEPTIGVLDAHWFNTDNRKMYVYQSDGWREVIRVFAAKLNNNTFSPMGDSNSSKPYAGSQVGVSGVGIVAGRIIVDDSGVPIRRLTGQYFTTEDDFFVNGSPVNVIRLEANIINGTALENIARYQVVKFSQFGKINLSTYTDIQETIIAMSMEDMLINQTGTLCVQGVINNPLWNFTTVGAPLWVTGYGLLTETDPHITDPLTYGKSKTPVGRVLTPTSIYFDQGMGGKGDKGDNSTGVPLATDTVYGISRLSLPAVYANDPIVVGDNDPRLLPYNHPATHPATMITTDTYSFLTGINAQIQLHQLADRTLTSLYDVNAQTPVSGQYLTWNGTQWINGNGIRYLDDLLDVTLNLPSSPGISNGDVLVYDSGTQQWTSSTNQELNLNGQTIRGSNIINYSEQLIYASINSGALTIDYALGGVSHVILNQNVTSVSIVNTDAANPWVVGKAYSITFIVEQDNTGNRTLDWSGTNFKWDSIMGIPTVSAAASSLDVYTFITVNAGASWLAFVSGKNLS